MKILFALILSCLVFISMASALSVNIPIPINYSLIPTVNDSLYWDGHSFVYGSISDIESDPLWQSWVDTGGVCTEGNKCGYFSTCDEITDPEGCGALTSESDPKAYNGTLAYNSSLSNYYSILNPFGFYNSTNFNINDYYLNNNPYGYYNSTSLPTASIGYFINYTPSFTTGNIINGSLRGYLAGNSICSTYYSGSHMCQADEIINSINRGDANTNFTATFWDVEVTPGYLANANDCDGWTSSTASYLGSIFVASTSHLNTYGSGSLVSCGASRQIGCCK